MINGTAKRRNGETARKPIRHFRDLEVYQNALATGLRVYELSKKFPPEVTVKPRVLQSRLELKRFDLNRIGPVQLGNKEASDLGEELMHKLGKSTVINQRLYLFPNLSDSGEYRGTFDFATVTKLSKRLGWQNSVSDVYVTNPPLGKRQNDLIVTTGLNISTGSIPISD